MVQLCPRCRHANPASASFCHFDGNLLKQGASAPAPPGRLPQPFTFPGGSRCASYDEFVAACYAEWDAARGMLLDGSFAGFFQGVGRADLARAARDAAALPDHDIGLTNFIASLPASIDGPKLGLNPRRLVVGGLHIGETRTATVKVVNEGRGTLMGKVTVADGGDWLRLASADGHSASVQTGREQTVPLRIDATGLVVGQNYSGKLVVVTSGGVAEIPVRLDLAARPCPHPPYIGAASPQELARRMRDNPRPAVPLLEGGDIARWFSSNGWTYPVVGTPAPGLAAVQQFFEELGLARAPQIRMDQGEIRLALRVPESPTAQVVVSSPARKLVYARAEPDVPWIRVVTPSASGQIQAALTISIDPAHLTENRTYEGNLRVIANAGQAFTVRVVVEVTGNARSWFAAKPGATITPSPSPAPAPVPQPAPVPVTPAARPAQPPPPTWLPPAPQASGPAAPGRTPAAPFTLANAVTLGAFVALAGRILLVLPADFYARLLRGGGGSLVAWLRPPAEDSFLPVFVLATAWVGAVVGVWLARRSGGTPLDLLCGAVAGLVGGAAASATVGSVLVLGDAPARWLLSALVGGRDLSAPLATPLWLAAALCCWLLLGGLAGGLLHLLGPAGRRLLGSAAAPVAAAARLAGSASAADFFTVPAE